MLADAPSGPAGTAVRPLPRTARLGSVTPLMGRPARSPASPTGDSLVGTLLGLGLLLVMVAVAVALLSTTQGRVVPVAEIRTGPATTTPCPPEVQDQQGASTSRTCMNLAVRNLGQAAGLATCTIADLTPGVVARFAVNDAHVYSTNVEPGATEELLVRIDGDGETATPLVVDCRGSAPLGS
jgi:hypothetical protein